MKDFFFLKKGQQTIYARSALVRVPMTAMIRGYVTAAG